MKRVRGPNFTREEIVNLLRLVEKYPIVNSPEIDGLAKGSKSKAWRSIMMEYNAQSKFPPRTVANLLSCYRNYKMRVKKLRDRIKTGADEPSHFDVLELYNQHAFEQIFNDSSCSECPITPNSSILQDKSLQKENKYTGDQQPSSSSSGPQTANAKISDIPTVECHYSNYEGDSDEQDYHPKPISLPIKFPTSNKSIQEEDQTTDDENFMGQQINNKKKKINLRLEKANTEKKNGVTQSFKELAENKKELVGSQKLLANLQIQHEQIKIALMKEQLQFTKMKNELELEFLKQKHELELSLLRRKNE